MAHIADPLSVVELGVRARTSDDACVGRHDQAIWLLAQGKPLADVAATTGFVQRWLERLASRYDQFGPNALGDRRLGARQNSIYLRKTDLRKSPPSSDDGRLKALLDLCPR